MLIEDAYRQYSDRMVHAMLRFCRDEDAAKDAVSHAFTQALVNQAMVESLPDQAAKAWLFTAARNAVQDIKRRESRFTELGDLDLPDPALPDPTSRVTVEVMLDMLPTDLRIPITLKYYQGYNATEIGAAMGLPAATVRTRLRTAIGKMRQSMKGE